MTKTPLMNNPLKDPLRAQNMYRIVDKIFDHWKLNLSEKALMLGVEGGAYHMIRNQKEIPATEEMLLRVSDTIAIFRILATMYDFDHDTIGRRWIKRKNWRAPFYGDRPLDHIARGYLALEATRRHLEVLVESCEGVEIGKASVVIGDALIGEIVSFNNFALLEKEDADILATMIVRVCESWKLLPDEVRMITRCCLSELESIALTHLFPDEKVLIVWRMILMISHGLLIIHHGKEDEICKWMTAANIGLKKGMTPLEALKNGDHMLLYQLLKSHLPYMP